MPQVTIKAGQTTSDVTDIARCTMISLAIPAGYADGNITLQASDTATGTFTDVYDSGGTIVTITVAGASRVISLTGTQFQAVAPLSFIRLKVASGPAADRVISIITKG